MTEMTSAERAAQRADAERRITEIRGVIRALWSDRDDPEIDSEVVALLGALRQAEEVFKCHD